MRYIHVYIDREASRIRTAPGRAVWRRTGSGGGERSIFKHKGQGQARWSFRAWGSGGDGSGGDGIYGTHMIIRSGPFERKDGTFLSTWQRPKQDSCLTNSFLHCFIVPFTC